MAPPPLLVLVNRPELKLETEGKVNIFFTFVLRLNLDENFMGIAVLYFASLCLFFRRFFEVFKINFVTKSDKVQIYKKHQMTNFFAENKIKREKYLKESMFLKFFDNFKNKHGILSQKFAAGVTKLEDLTVLLKKPFSLPSLGRNLQEVGFFFQEPSCN